MEPPITPEQFRTKEVLNSRRTGDIVSLQHLEPVGYWHQAHSFVRGKWRNEAESSPMLLAKSCHDIDGLRYIMGKPCRSVSSFGNSRHFRASEKPEGAGDRCLECPEHIETQCPYSAKRYYLGCLERGHLNWSLSIITDDLTEASVMNTLKTAPTDTDTSDEFVFTNNTANRRHRVWVRSDDYLINLTHQVVLERRNFAGNWVAITVVGNGSKNISSIERELDLGTYRYIVMRQSGTQGAYDMYRTYVP